MAKRNKKNIRKRVKRNARKIKELTAEDILLNPALVESPQFKTLPIEKQIMLMNQVKQLRAIMTQRPTGTVSHSSGSSDQSMFNRINELNNKVSRQTRENEQLRVAYQASNEALKREKALSNEIKRKAQEQKDTVERNARINQLEQENQRLDLRAQDTEAQKLEKQIKEKEQMAHAQAIKDKQEENYKLNARLNYLNQATKIPTTPTKPLFSRPFTPLSEGSKRILTERYGQRRKNMIELNSVFQNQINSFTRNGDESKAEEAEQRLNENIEVETIDIDDGIGDKKKPLNENPTGLTPQTNAETETNTNDVAAADDSYAQFNLLHPVEKQAIKTETDLENQTETRKEQIENYEKILKQQQQNKQEIDLMLAQNSNKLPETPASKLSLEEEKANLIKEFNNEVQNSSNPDYEFMKTMTNRIQSAKTFQEIKNIRRICGLDKSSQETKIKQDELWKKQQENYDEYMRSQALSRPYLYDNLTSQIQLEDIKKQSFKALDDLMNLAENPNKQ